MADLLGSWLISCDRKIEQYRAVISMVAHGPSLPARWEMPASCRSGWAYWQARGEVDLTQHGVGAGRSGDGVKSQDTVITAVGDKEGVSMTQDFICTV